MAAEASAVIESPRSAFGLLLEQDGSFWCSKQKRFVPTIFTDLIVCLCPQVGVYIELKSTHKIKR